MNSIRIIVFVILACLLNAKPEIKSLVSVESPAESVDDSADANATYEVFYQQAINCFRSVSSHLTWRLAFNSTFRHLFSLPSNEIKTGMKGQSARLMEPPVISIRITANENACDKIARGRPWNCHHLIRKLLHVENCRIYYTPLPRRLKRGYKLRFKRTSIAEKGRSDVDNQTEKRSSCIYKDSLNDALKYLYQVLCVLSFESLTAKGTLIPSLFYDVLPSFHFLFIIATILFTVNFQSLFRWFQVQLKEKGFQSIRTLLDDKILHYEGLAFKEQPTKEEYLTMKIELPGFHVFARELENLANELRPGVGFLPSIL